MDIQKNGRSIIRVESRTYKNRDFLDIREYFLNLQEEWTPTKKGVTVPPGLIGELLEAIKKETQEDKS